MYIDTSALVKLYVGEPDSEACEAIVAGMTLVSSRLLYCEFRSALNGKIAQGNVPPHAGSIVWENFEEHLASRKIRLVALNDVLVQDAADLLEQIPTVHLRTLDAIHLATYLSIDAGPLFTKDRRMLQAAAKLGLPLAG
jgi:predicted nucleic acid-binding protein